VEANTEPEFAPNAARYTVLTNARHTLRTFITAVIEY
jgi:hypothetical protein